MKNERAAAILASALAVLSLASAGHARAGGLPKFDLNGKAASRRRPETDGEAPTAFPSPVSEPDSSNTEDQDFYRNVIDANQKLAQFVGALDLSAVPPDVQDALRAQARGLASTARRLPAFAAKARKELAAPSLFVGIAEKFFQGREDSSEPAKLILKFIIAHVQGALQDVAGGLGPGGKEPDVPPMPPVPPGTDRCTEFMAQLRWMEAQSNAYQPYSDVSLANLALGVAFNNLAQEVHRLAPAELSPLIVQLNAEAARQNLKGIDSKAMSTLKSLIDQAGDQSEDRLDREIGNLLKDAPDDFKAKVQGIMDLSVTRVPIK